MRYIANLRTTSLLTSPPAVFALTSNNDVDRQEDIDCSFHGLNVGSVISDKRQIDFNSTDADSMEWKW